VVDAQAVELGLAKGEERRAERDLAPDEGVGELRGAGGDVGARSGPGRATSTGARRARTTARPSAHLLELRGGQHALEELGAVGTPNAHWR
jgi:hypothetical protein